MKMEGGRIAERLQHEGAWSEVVAKTLAAFWFHSVDAVQDARVRAVLAELLTARVPWQFFIAPASSTGKNHPSWQNPTSGLLRHVTEMAVGIWRIAQAYPELTDANALPSPHAMDILLASVVLHDAFKGGVPWENRTVPNHHALAAEAWREAAGNAWLEPMIVENVSTAIRWHAGRWTPEWDGRMETLGTRKNVYAAVLHHCDMVYSDTNLNLLYQPVDIPLTSLRKR